MERYVGILICISACLPGHISMSGLTIDWWILRLGFTCADTLLNAIELKVHLYACGIEKPKKIKWKWEKN